MQRQRQGLNIFVGVFRHARRISNNTPTMPSIPLKRTSTAERSVSPPPTKRRSVSTATAPQLEQNGKNVTTTTSGALRKVASTTNKKLVQNFFAKASEKAPERTKWDQIGNSLYICRYDKVDEHKHVRPRKVALFDFDSTLVITQSGKKFGREAGDWTWWHSSVEQKLKQLVHDGYLVCIISNQAGLKAPDAKTKAPTAALNKKTSEWKQKVKAVLDVLDLPITLYAARDHDTYRKPRIGMWEQLLKDHDLHAADIDMNGSIFVGDAAGRIAGPMGGKDFSCSDRDFATNVGIPFKTPEEYFLGQEERPWTRNLEPSKYLDTINNSKTDESPIVFTKKNNQDIILFVGSPGAGKSSFFWRHLEPLGYERVNQDILGSRDKCLRRATEYLTEGQSVAVDNTNADMDVRKAWLDLAAKHNVPVRVVLFTASPKLCEHNDTVRALGGIKMNPESRTMLPKMAFSGFAGRYVEPSVREGFQDITKVDFRFEGGEVERKIWGRFWIT
ncbi:polynucleotide kinase 3 phosphatase-domain-containing protein [Elsinoe ampelina]|uniref:Polynucleotide kinase 3 phosphatase-domain-containing protein n=1 Tax=Elsinoe ampelina TaxID=302913 RepID=A0A6A6FY76_9PEZI|nr:polynucleotide kinase 3 phosphatase-domain-containing protein [Elsinoe ampelina]